MAREFGRLRVSIGADRDFEEQLSPAGQWLFARIMVPEPTLNHAGVFDWRPRRLLSKARGLDLGYIEAAAAECEAGRFLLFDLDTDECLARSYIRSEELLRNPKMAVAVVNAFYAIASRQLRAQIVDELLRIRDEHPEYSSWDSSLCNPQLTELLDQPASNEVGYVDAYSNRITDQPVVRNGNHIGNREEAEITNVETVQNGDPIPNGLGMAKRSAFPAPAPAPKPAPNNGGGNYTEVTTEQPASIDYTQQPPPRYCSEHPNGTSSACGDCMAARKANADWLTAREAQQSAARQANLAAVRSQRDDELAEAAERGHEAAQAIVECELCDDDGYTAAGIVCSHREHSTPETRAAAREAVAAALKRRDS